MNRFRMQSPFRSVRHHITRESVLRAGFCALVGVVFGLRVLIPAPEKHVEATSSSGTVSVQIVPPGGLGAETEDALIQPGTLSASIAGLPDSALSDDVTTINGIFVVEDHRSRDCGWTVRVSDQSQNPSRLVGVDVGGIQGGPPQWAYEGVHAWDAAAGMSMADVPALASSTEPGTGGCGITLNQMTIAVSPPSASADEAPQTLMVILPAAP